MRTLSLTRLKTPLSGSCLTPSDVKTLLVVHDGADYAARTGLVAEARRLAAGVVLLEPVGDRLDCYAADEEYATRLEETTRVLKAELKAERLVGLGTSLGALALLHAEARHRLFDGLYLQSGSFFRADEEDYEAKFRHFGRLSGFVAEVHAGAGELPPTVITCGQDEENLACNEALAASLHRHGALRAFAVFEGGHDWPQWDLALSRLPALVDQFMTAARRPTFEP